MYLPRSIVIHITPFKSATEWILANLRNWLCKRNLFGSSIARSLRRIKLHATFFWYHNTTLNFELLFEKGVSNECRVWTSVLLYSWLYISSLRATRKIFPFNLNIVVIRKTRRKAIIKTSHFPFKNGMIYMFSVIRLQYVDLVSNGSS